MQSFIKYLQNRNRLRLQKRRQHAEESRRQRESEKKPLAVMGIFKNEELNIAEWIEHYLWQGADQIFIIDNGSTDKTLAIVRSFLPEGKIQLLELSEPHRQVKHYKTAFKTFEIDKLYRWLIIADSDEFWFCKNGQKIKDVLDFYEDVNVVYVNTTNFGSNGFDEHPENLRENLIMREPCLGRNTDTKWIARTVYLSNGDDIHLHKIRDADSGRVVSDNARFQINHYINQSRQYYFGVKTTRGDATSASLNSSRNEAAFREVDANCSVRDTLLADYVSGRKAPSESQTGLVKPPYDNHFELNRFRRTKTR